MIRRILGFLSVVTFGWALMFGSAVAATNIPTPAVGDIGDGGTWLTEHNVLELNENMTRDLDSFQSGFRNQLVKDFVPIEARVGMAFMNAMVYVGRVLDNSLIRFVNIFLIVMYLFWVMFEAYTAISGKVAARQVALDVIKKGALISVWIIVLRFGPAQLFMWVMGPIVRIGTFMSDMILDAVTRTAGTTIPDTCDAIRAYAATHTSPDMLVYAEGAADIMCVPTRMSGFFYTGVAAGWQWTKAGIGHSALTSVVGMTFIGVFTYNIWRFALTAFGVIADLFLTIFMLPFTAIKECLGKTNYSGIAGQIFNSFLGLFHADSLQAQAMRFLKASIYFVSLSIVVGLCATLMSTFMTMDLMAQTPSITNTDFMTTLLSALLVMYLIKKSDTIVSNLGGSIDQSVSNKIQADLNILRNNAKNLYKQVRAATKKKKS